MGTPAASLWGALLNLISAAFNGFVWWKSGAHICAFFTGCAVVAIFWQLNLFFIIKDRREGR